jgi:hypothetical protein
VWSILPNDTDENCIDSFSPKHMRRKDHLGDLSLDGKIILKCILNIYDLRTSAEFMYQLRAIVNTLLTHRIPYKVKMFSNNFAIVSFLRISLLQRVN